ncbi:MAG TPA: hypothetical protein VMV10_07590 [Pirellulales bacterium]|nr:hypothetical protein [Pirellulales bacterium]
MELNLEQQLAALKRAEVRELQARYVELFGERPAGACPVLLSFAQFEREIINRRTPRGVDRHALARQAAPRLR